MLQSDYSMSNLKVLQILIVLLCIYNVGIIAQKNKSNKKVNLQESFLIYETNSYSLYSDKIIEGKDTAFIHKNSIVNAMREHIVPDLEGKYPEIDTNIPIVGSLYQLALNDLELCNVNNHHFRISPDFPRNAYYTRDIAYSSMLGACFTHSPLIKKHLEIVREQRKEIGYKTPASHIVPYLGELNVITNDNITQGYDNAPVAKRTDDICWVIGYYDALCVNGTKKEFEWLLNEFDFFDKLYYSHFKDSSTGLYRGQSTFIDIAGTGYPSDFNFQTTIMIKALSTNCLYVKAFECLEKAANHVGDIKRATNFAKRKSEIKKLILKHFLHPDGYYAYFIHEDGSFEEKRELMGMSFLVLFDILTPSEFKIAIENYPKNDYGNPLLWPFYPKTKIYHNKAIWPFANTFFNWAEMKHKRNDEVVERTLGNLSRNMLWGNFTEVMDYDTGGKVYKHARSYIWSASSYLTLIYRLFAGIEFTSPDTITFKPYLPDYLKGKLNITNIKLGETSVDLKISGNGSNIKSVFIDGKESDNAELNKDGKHHLVEIFLSR